MYGDLSVSEKLRCCLDFINAILESFIKRRVVFGQNYCNVYGSSTF